MAYTSPSPGNGPLVNLVRMGGKYLPRRLLFDGRGRRGFVVIVEVVVDSEKVSRSLPWKVDDVYRWNFAECVRERERMGEVRLNASEVHVWQRTTSQILLTLTDVEVSSLLLLLLLLLLSPLLLSSSGVKQSLILPSILRLLHVASLRIPRWSLAAASSNSNDVNANIRPFKSTRTRPV